MRNILFQEVGVLIILTDKLTRIEKGPESVIFKFVEGGAERLISIRLNNSDNAFEKIVAWMNTDKTQLIIRENKKKK